MKLVRTKTINEHGRVVYVNCESNNYFDAIRAIFTRSSSVIEYIDYVKLGVNA